MVLPAIAAAAAVVGGVMTHQSAQKQSRALKDQADLQSAESLREANRVQEEHDRLSKKQKLAFLKNGVSLAGSPLLVLQDTVEEGRDQAEAIRRRGSAASSLSRKQAGIARNQGRAALIRGVGGAASSLAQLV